MKHESDLLIIGTGIAGLSLAATAAEEGLSVILITKEDSPEESNTFYAQGGIIGDSPQDSGHLLEEDILRTGYHYGSKPAVRLTARKGPEIVREFLVKKIGVPFSRNADGELNFTKEASHRIRRILHCKDRTGAVLQKSLLSHVSRRPNIRLFSSFTALELILNTKHSRLSEEVYKKPRVIGAYALNNKSGAVDIFFAPAVVMASGGAGQLYRYTTNPPSATGDGIAMARRAGARILNMEYIQFHPTSLYHKNKRNFLISEATRGEGAELLDAEKKPFLHRYKIKDGVLAPRDQLSRGIYRETDRSGIPYVYLDLRNLSSSRPEQRFPSIYETCKKLGIDFLQEPLPVTPAAHYSCGGIYSDLKGRSGLEGLYAVGEAACTGLHGANRLASASLLEAVTFGCLLGQDIGKQLKTLPRKLKDSVYEWTFPSRHAEFDPVLIKSDLRYLQTIMWNHVGIIRTRKRLNRALADLTYLGHRVEKFYKDAHLSREIVELRNTVTVAGLIARAAVKNPHSRGCHYIESE